MPAETELHAIEEVHVAPLGYEYDRIVEPALEYGADAVYLLADHEHEHACYHERLEATLREAEVEVLERSVDLLDMYDVLGEVTSIVDEHPDDVVRVNVSSGPKLSTVGAALACMATDAVGYHVHPEDHEHAIEETPRTSGMLVAEQLPSYPLETPTPDQVKVMDYVETADDATSTPKKSDLIDFAEDAGLDFVTSPEPANDKAKFALLNNRVLDPLIANGYLDVEPVGRSKQVTLTETGENALKAFRHKL